MSATEITKDTVKHSTLITLILGALGTAGYQPIVAVAQEEITKQVTERVVKIEQGQAEIAAEQRSLKEAQAAQAKANDEKLNLILKLMEQRQQ